MSAAAESFHVPWSEPQAFWRQANGEKQHFFEITGDRSVQALCGLMALRKSLKQSNAPHCPVCRVQQPEVP